MKPRQFIFLLFVVLFSSCLKDADIQPNLHTTISGQFYDPSNKEVYSGVKIRIAAFQKSTHFIAPDEYQLVGYVDSTTTDNNGNYSIFFTTKGNASDYFLQIIGLDPKIFLSVSSNTGGTFRSIKIDSLGNKRILNFNVLKYYYLKLKVKVIDNQNPPLNVFIASNSFQLGSPGKAIYGKNNDTVDIIPILKNTGGFNLLFTIKNSTTGIYHNNDPIPLNPVITSDTTDGGTYTLNPSNFK